MLEIRPNCEWCDKDLWPDAKDARICSYECTFCQECVENDLNNRCPNCGGDFVKRPIRPNIAWRNHTSLAFQPPSKKRIHSPYSDAELQVFYTQLIAVENKHKP